jgi:hypothetical protein
MKKIEDLPTFSSKDQAMTQAKIDFNKFIKSSSMKPTNLHQIPTKEEIDLRLK